MDHVVSVRCPSGWQGRVNSDQLRAWVLAWLRQPVILPGDPGPGPYKLSIRFSGMEFAALRKARRTSLSSDLRAIAALNGAPFQTGGSNWLTGALGVADALLKLLAGTTDGVGHGGGQNA